MDDGFGWYRVGNVIVGMLVFISAWIYCISEYGFLWGFGFGWLPAAILAAILAFLWPVVANRHRRHRLCCPEQKWADIRTSSVKNWFIAGLMVVVLSGCADIYPPRSYSGSSVLPAPIGQKVYSADECVGAVVNGVCHGTIIPKPGYQKTCYGEMLFGRCTGPMF